MRCSYHPDIETQLRCSKCEKPICPKCMIQTPVGARCRECAQLRKSPIYAVDNQTYLRAIATGIGVALAGGLIWAGADFVLRGFLSLIIAIGIGYGMGELVSQSASHKRGSGLPYIGAACVVLSFFAHSFFWLLLRNLELASLNPLFISALVNAAIESTFASASNLMGLIAMGVAIYLTVIRLR